MSAPSGPSSVGQSRIGQRREERRRKSNDRSDERYRSILRAGAQVFRDRGYDRATLHDVADAVGISRPSLYYYIGTKEELLVEILQEPLIEMTRRIQRVAELDMPATERLRRAVADQMATFDEYYPEMFVFLAEWLHLDGGQDRGQVTAREYGEVMTRIIADGQRGGEFRADVDSRVAMLGIVGMSNWVHRWYRRDGELTLAQIGEQFAMLALDGLRHPG